MPENPASYRVVRTKSYLFNKADLILQLSKSSIYSTKPTQVKDVSSVYIPSMA
ncbi:TonB-dependent receptor, Outer membrane receptor for ferric enterobactin and colicins B, D (plasmid) [Klebsiella pneumoniae]|uniref:TonB-dependent receptor n=1 Tax=Klebsiella pneumoniae TaxID=573 RepID=A0A2U8T1M9_KLEPN|nr:hypothetical protein [Klebsiella pneumoniae]WMW26695.1 TonB-dependent receptor [Escherichia coli]AUB50585.1 TonB-dependent receptor, Outer membrane receptor for ferric enterobactin and colicins B, D [Klebsiella pneumoniae]AWM64136.1 TonB-dependent receptor [Klebsiella pneumoniae]QIQ13784.1 TonB-dependent receptor [Klebsiella pneumoniae]QIQ14912.1 TonB-dependent receptor [Klebsiella pneumoniae]